MSTPGVPTLYFDLASPYAYLAVARAPSVLGCLPELQPVLLGAMFAHRGFGSWAHTPTRDAQMQEVRRRATAYGVALVWPANWPPNSLVAQRAAIFARRQGLVHEFVRRAYAAEYGRGADLADPQTVLAAGREAGLDEHALTAALQDADIKAELREATDRAIALGVSGVPTLRVGQRLFYGDDQLPAAAALL